MQGFFLRSLAVAAVAAFTLPASAAQPLNAVEQIYADLAKLPDAERAKKIEEGAEKEGEVNLFRGLGTKEGNAQLEIFQKHYPKVKLKYHTKSSQIVAEEFLQEEAAGKHLTDVAGIGSPDLGEVIGKGLAARYPTPATKAILPIYKGFLDSSGENRWIPWYATSHGIGYNPTLLKPADAPKSWTDLCNPRYKGDDSFEPAETRLLLGFYAIFGEDMTKVDNFLECLGKNDPIIMRGHTTRTFLLMAGDHSLSGDQLIYRGIFENRKAPTKAPFAVVYEAPVVMDAEGLVINRNTPHPYAAALHVDWTLSAESQQVMFDNFREALAFRHPFFPDNVQVIPSMFREQSIVDRLHASWKKYIGDKR
jgi:iron(III) transport system substrate-binding protein